MPTLAQRMSRARPSAIMAVAMKAKAMAAAGRDVISFSIGVPNFLPGEHVYAAAREALAHDSGNYGTNRGREDLLDGFLLHLRRAGIDGYERKHVVTGIGNKHLLFNTMYALLEEGDEVLVPTPYWTTYVDICDILGATAKLLHCPPEADYKLTPAQLEAAIGPKTKLVLFNNPSNPTGMVYTPDEVQALADVLARHDVWVISDDIYNRMIFDGLPYQHLVLARPELRDCVILMDSVSKTYGMPGWRVGCMAGPESIIDAVVRLNSNHITNLPEVTTAAAAAAYTGPQDIPERMCREFQAKRDQVLATFARIPGIRCPKPQGAFYVFPDVSAFFGKRHGDVVIANDVDLCNALLEAEGVAIVPGSAFGEPRAARLSYTLPPSQLTEGLARIERFFVALG
jgi:aspartate aminotransferase